VSPSAAGGGLGRKAEGRGGEEIEGEGDQHHGAEAEAHRQEGREDGTEHRGAAVDAPGPGEEAGRLCGEARQGQRNGIPMQKASGATSAREIGILAMTGSGISRSNSGGRTRRLANATSAIPPTATVIGEIAGAKCHAVKRRSGAAAVPLPSPAKTRNPHNTREVA
jgi:hypothetical protein